MGTFKELDIIIQDVIRTMKTNGYDIIALKESKRLVMVREKYIISIDPYKTADEATDAFIKIKGRTITRKEVDQCLKEE